MIYQAPAPAAPGKAPALDQSSPAPFSTGLAEMLKLLDAGTDVGVIKAYIQNSAVAYQPTADEIIALHQRGVPSDIMAAMIQRGGQVRAEAASAQPVAPAPAAPSAPAPSSLTQGTVPPLGTQPPQATPPPQETSGTVVSQPAPASTTYVYAAPPVYPAYPYNYVYPSGAIYPSYGLSIGVGFGWPYYGHHYGGGWYGHGGGHGGVSVHVGH